MDEKNRTVCSGLDRAENMDNIIPVSNGSVTSKDTLVRGRKKERR